ncbi:MAG: hypothetical protein KatS3mg035_1672 [Bacteroidia bacterium]|nr:MAG: hypothetical protein KatS3mg035_1672 [Bacteroidia bacterium]
MQYWLVKSEPETFSWDDLEKAGSTVWDGVRNYQARNHLKNMQLGDLVLFYHSVSEKSVVGLAKVIKTAYQDPTTDDPRWLAVDIEPVQKLAQPVPLEWIKNQPLLAKYPFN